MTKCLSGCMLTFNATIKGLIKVAAMTNILLHCTFAFVVFNFSVAFKAGICVSA